MVIRIDPEAVLRDCDQLLHCVKEGREHLQKMRRIGEETKECWQSDTEQLFYERFQEFVGHYEKIIRFHEELVRELKQLCQDYTDLEQSVVRRLDMI